MFKREQQTGTNPSENTNAVAEPANRLNEARLPRCFQPSSFASRKAQADEHNRDLSKRRLVSLGETEYTQRNLRTGEIDVAPARLYFDRDHPRDRWVEINGVPGRHALNPGGDQEKVKKLPPLKQRTRGVSAVTEAAAPDRVWTP